jgi:tRNA (adenine22-N1)-methyltransferase
MPRGSTRLEAALDLLTETEFLADVGCDHGYFPIEALRSGKVRIAVASDNKSGPLGAAEAHIRKVGLSDRIATVLSEGLSHLTPEIGTVSIMGMGGATIVEILANAELKRVRRLILGPNKDPSRVREWLETHHWKIADERFVRDHGHDYQLIAAVPGDMTLSSSEREFGPFILAARNPEFVRYIERKIAQFGAAKVSAKDGKKRLALETRISHLQELIR